VTNTLIPSENKSSVISIMKMTVSLKMEPVFMEYHCFNLVLEVLCSD